SLAGLNVELFRGICANRGARNRPGWLILAMLVFVGGCSREPKLVAVTGTVKIDGKPADKVLVNFWPADGGAKNFTTRHAVGISDAQGRFALFCSGGAEGLEAGEYKVTLSRPVAGGKAVQTSATIKAEGVGTVESIPARYLKPADSPISASVSETNHDFVFEVSLK